jgi:rhodanese-related sulfurtransferase
MYAFLSHKSQPLEIDIAAAEALLRDGEAYLLDVRQGWEWRRGHVQGAIHVPLDQLPTLVWKLPRDKPLAIICQHGERSLAAAHFLAARDFEGVASVAGGTVAWARSGRALVRD